MVKIKSVCLKNTWNFWWPWLPNYLFSFFVVKSYFTYSSFHFSGTFLEKLRILLKCKNIHSENIYQCVNIQEFAKTQLKSYLRWINNYKVLLLVYLDLNIWQNTHTYPNLVPPLYTHSSLAWHLLTWVTLVK